MRWGKGSERGRWIEQLRQTGGKKVAEGGRVRPCSERGQPGEPHSLSFSFLHPPLPPFLPSFLAPSPSPGTLTPEAEMAIQSRGEVRSMEEGWGAVDEDLSSLSSPPIPCTMFLKMKVFYIRCRWETAKTQIPEPLNQISKGALESAF